MWFGVSCSLCVWTVIFEILSTQNILTDTINSIVVNMWDLLHLCPPIHLFIYPSVSTKADSESWLSPHVPDLLFRFSGNLPRICGTGAPPARQNHLIHHPLQAASVLRGHKWVLSYITAVSDIQPKGSMRYLGRTGLSSSIFKCQSGNCSLKAPPQWWLNRAAPSPYITQEYSTELQF